MIVYTTTSGTPDYYRLIINAYASLECSGEPSLRSGYIASIKEAGVIGVYEATILKGFLSFSEDFIRYMICDNPIQPWVEYELE